MAPSQVRVSNMSRKGRVCSPRTRRSTGEKVMFTAAQELSPQRPRGAFSERPLRPGLRGRAKGETLGNGLKTEKIKIWTWSCVNRREQREGSRNWAERGHQCLRTAWCWRNRAGPAQDGGQVGRRGGWGWTRVDAGPAPMGQGSSAPLCTHLSLPPKATLR